MAGKSSTGQNIVWLMNGTTLGSYVELMQVTDINWQTGSAPNKNGSAKVVGEYNG